jgi:uncharacterized damage-inducible protein DinB
MARNERDGNALLVELLDQAFERRAWHGVNLRGSLRGVTPAQASWRPGPDRHNIWEIALHCAYWKYAVYRRVAGGIKRGSFPRTPSNWPALPASSDGKAWKADIRLLEATHRTLREAVLERPLASLGHRQGRWRLLDHVAGIAAHDVYHAGQIQLLKRLQRG